MERYDVYLYNVPKVSDEGKVVPIAPPETHELSEVEAARKLAAEHRDRFERVVVMRTSDGAQKLVERYVDGQHDVPEGKEDPEQAPDGDD